MLDLMVILLSLEICPVQDQLDFQVHWIAYQLQPFAPPEGMRKQEYLELKFKDQADYLLQQKKVPPLYLPP